MTHAVPRTVVLQLSETDRLGVITVDADAFDRFEQSLELATEKLIEAWKHMAAPRANSIRRNAVTK